MIALLDHVSVQPKLYIKGNQRYITIFGMVISLLVFVSVLGLSIYFLAAFFQKKEVNVISNTEYKNIPKVFEMDFYMWKYYNMSDGKDYDPRITELVHYKITVDEDNKTYERLNSEPCSLEKHFKNY